MIIDLKVKASGGGETVRLTLSERVEGERQAKDCQDDLFENENHVEFYRAVARYLHILHREGHNVAYEDVKP